MTQSIDDVRRHDVNILTPRGLCETPTRAGASGLRAGDQ